MLGDHHLWRKLLPYEASSHVPFFISWKNMDLKPGAFDGLVSLEDVAATIFDLCGVEIPNAWQGPNDSQSLAPALRGDSCHTRDRLLGECTGMAHNFIVENEWKYIHFTKTGEEQLFRVVEGSDECTDLSAENPQLLEHFRGHLADYLADRDDRPFEPAACKPCGNKPQKAIWGNKLPA